MQLCGSEPRPRVKSWRGHRRPHEALPTHLGDGENGRACLGADAAHGEIRCFHSTPSPATVGTRPGVWPGFGAGVEEGVGLSWKA